MRLASFHSSICVSNLITLCMAISLIPNLDTLQDQGLGEGPYSVSVSTASRIGLDPYIYTFTLSACVTELLPKG